jgi:hypothetical protein
MEYGELVDPQREFFIYKTGSGGKNYSSNGVGLDNEHFEALSSLVHKSGDKLAGHPNLGQKKAKKMFSAR